MARYAQNVDRDPGSLGFVSSEERHTEPAASNRNAVGSDFLDELGHRDLTANDMSRGSRCSSATTQKLRKIQLEQIQQTIMRSIPKALAWAIAPTAGFAVNRSMLYRRSCRNAP